MLNKKCLTTFGLLSLTLLLGFISLHVMQLCNFSKWVGVLIASGIFVVMLILKIVFRKRNFISYIVIPINGLANGIAVSSLFVYFDKFPELWHTALLFVALCLLFYVYCILAKLLFFQKHFVICICIYMLLLISIGITCSIIVGKAIFLLALLSLIPFAAFLLLLVSKSKNLSELIKFGAYYSFTILILIIFIVIIVLSQGEALENLGDFGSGLDYSNKRKNPYDYPELLK